jgi:HK97 family phage portal protein
MLDALFRERAVTVPWNVSDDIGWGNWVGDNATGVNEHTASTLLAVYGSVSFITDEISTLPVHVDGAPRPAWVDRPSEGLDRIAWLGQIVWSLLLPGNAYLAVMGDPANPSALDPIDPSKVKVVRSGGRRVVLINGIPASFPIVHIPGRMRPGDLEGMSPVEWARRSIGLGIAAQKYGADWFEGDGNMPGVIESPVAMQPGTIRQIATQWLARRRTGGRGLPGVLQNGARWRATGVTNEQAQFLATRKYTAAEIAGQMFLLDPSDLGIPVEGSSLTYANLEQRNTRRMQVALMPWIRRIESQLSQIISQGEYRFDVDSRLRGNTRESYETLKVGLDAGFLTVPEVRNILGLRDIWASMQVMDTGANDLPPAELARMIQAIYLGAGVVISVDEARDILNKTGADLPAGFEQTVTFGDTTED